MFLAKIVFAAAICTVLTNFSFVAGQNEDGDLNEPEKKKEPPLDNHTFVALIDVVFSDGKKKTCTGTIIHDNVVITAAHCFVGHSKDAEAELTASFVVIGTRKMYETGYENYLPIERVITHPKYRGWTADLALVFTFAGMTSDKPGNVMPLMGESALTPVDSNVTVLSWGHCKNDMLTELSTRGSKQFARKRQCDSNEDNESCEPRPSTGGPLRVAYSSENQDQSNERDKSDSSNQKNSRIQDSTERYPNILRLDAQGGEPDASSVRPTRRTTRSRRPTSQQPTFHPSRTDATKNRYTTTSQIRRKRRMRKSSQALRHRYKKASRNTSYIDPNLLNVATNKEPIWTVRKPRSFSKEEDLEAESTTETDQTTKEQNKKDENDIQKHYQGWRRSAGSVENKLTTEIFGFVNVQTCKKLVDKAMPKLYSINTNEVVCYAAEEHYISTEDSGAPAIRQGHLVAVTLGGVECDGDHVAIGIKMSCFCTWIAENLPSGGENLRCCKNCCGEHKEQQRYYRQRQTNHYLQNVRVDST
ncbi:hypothetical protein B5X24_HaOG212998 [Helicoverpa armigera]|nr:hypothetical protein B5X24_HaOG212998 [Helicoverpa armigera]